MKKRVAWAIENAPDFDRKVLSNLVNQMDEDYASRFVNALIGLVDMDAEIAALPTHIDEFDGKTNLNLVSANYLTDTVRYSYDQSIGRYFKTAEQAHTFAESGRGRYDGQSKQDDEYQFLGVYVCTGQTEYGSFYSWTQMANGK